MAVAWVVCGHAVAACKLVKLAELPVTMVDMHPMVNAKINGADAMFVADSGAFFSVLTPASVAEFNLKAHPAPWNLKVSGMGGATDISVATVQALYPGRGSPHECRLPRRWKRHRRRQRRPPGPERVSHSRRRVRSGERPAIEDLDAADRATAREADARLRMALGYSRVDLMPKALLQLDLWIAAHEADARLAGALNERCRIKAITGVDLTRALGDCNAAISRTDKSDSSRAKYLDSRGLVRLRLGDYKKSIADYDEALALSPRDPWSLYGRGVDKLRSDRQGEGRIDMDAAVAVWPPVADAFRKRGIAP